MDTDQIETLRNLKERLVKLRREKARLLEMLDDLEAEGESEAKTLEKEISVLQAIIQEKKKPTQNETIFRF